MASNGTSLPVRNKANDEGKPLNRADEVDDVSRQIIHTMHVVTPLQYQTDSCTVAQSCSILDSAFH